MLSVKLTKMNEKYVLRGLNARFSGFIDKVRRLEHQNHLLEREIEDLRQRAHSASSLEQEYGSEIKELRQLLHDITHQKHQIEKEQLHLDDELYNLSKQCENETFKRSKAESSIVELKKDINDAYQAKLFLEKKAQSLVDEIHFSKRNHEVEVSEITSQIQDVQITVQAKEFGKPELTAALREIRAQLGTVDLQVAGESIRSQFAKLTESADTQRQALKASQQDIHEYRRHLQAKSIQLNCAKGTRGALERQLHDVEDRHNEDLIHYQDTIRKLENELINAKFDMSGHLREYQDLLNVKMALDVELLSYRKLLEGEESRLVTISDTHMAMPYIYRQSPVYSLPCISRQAGQAGRLEPRYKFVEEIITETTREIEMSDFEEDGSEETLGWGGDRDWVEREGESGEEGESPGNKNRAQGDSEQLSDSQQNYVEAVPQGGEHSRDLDEESPGGEGADRDDDREKDEPDMVEAGGSRESTDTDERTPNGVQVTTEVSTKKQHTQDYRNAARGEIQVLIKDTSSRQEDYMLAGPSESDMLIKNDKYNAGYSSGVDVEDSTGTAQAKQPTD